MEHPRDVAARCSHGQMTEQSLLLCLFAASASLYCWLNCEPRFLGSLAPALVAEPLPLLALVSCLGMGGVVETASWGFGSELDWSDLLVVREALLGLPQSVK